MTESYAWDALASSSETRRAQAETRLLAQYGRVVEYAASRRVRQLIGTTERSEDLEAALRLALLQAIRSYDPARGVKFLTFAIFSVNHAAQEFVRNATGARHRHGAQEVPVSQLAWPSGEDEDDQWSALLADRGRMVPSAEQEARGAALRQAVADAVRSLPPREARVLALPGGGHCMAALAREWGVTESRVWQIQAQARRRVRALLAEWE